MCFVFFFVVVARFVCSCVCGHCLLLHVVVVVLFVVLVSMYGYCVVLLFLVFIVVCDSGFALGVWCRCYDWLSLCVARCCLLQFVIIRGCRSLIDLLLWLVIVFHCCLYLLLDVASA